MGVRDLATAPCLDQRNIPRLTCYKLRTIASTLITEYQTKALDLYTENAVKQIRQIYLKVEGEWDNHFCPLEPTQKRSKLSIQKSNLKMIREEELEQDMISIDLYEGIDLDAEIENPAKKPSIGDGQVEGNEGSKNPQKIKSSPEVINLIDSDEPEDLPTESNFTKEDLEKAPVLPGIIKKSSEKTATHGLPLP